VESNEHAMPKPTPRATSTIRRVAAWLLACAAVLVAAGCLGSDAEDRPAGGSAQAGRGAEVDELTLVVPVQADALDTTKASVGSLGVLLLGLEPLVLYDSGSGELRPNLAKSFEQVDPVTYRYTLRAGVKFWDGTPLAIEDVLFSFDLHRQRGSESFIAQQWSGVKSLKRTGPNEITVNLAGPNPQFAFTVAQTGILSKDYYRRNRETIGSPGTLNMGTGPYRFESFKPSAETVLVRNEDYWGRRPHVARLHLRTVSDDATRLLALRSEDADGVIGIPLGQLSSFEGISGVEISSDVDYSVYKFNFDLTKKPWDDPRLRRAFASTVDRSAVAGGIFKEQAEEAASIVPRDVMEVLVPTAEVEAAYADIRELTPPFDLERAKDEMSQSTVPDGVSTTLLVTGSDPNLASIAQAVAQNAEQVGIDIEIKEVDDNTYYNAVYFKHTTDGLSLENFGADGPDASNIPSNALDSANGYPQGSGVNVSNYENGAVDRLLRESRTLEVDDPKRGQLLLEAQAEAAADLPFVPVAFPRIILGLKDEYRWNGFDTFWWLSRWPDQITVGG
jgi:peptide/nickel transport system substrate-binding protein